MTGTLATVVPPYTPHFGPVADIYGINNAGTMIGGFLSDPTSQNQYYVGGVPATTEYIDTSLRRGFLFGGINDAGVVVGYFRDSSNLTHGFIATPASDRAPAIPAPPSTWFLAAVFGTLCLWRRR